MEEESRRQLRATAALITLGPAASTFAIHMTEAQGQSPHDKDATLLAVT